MDLIVAVHFVLMSVWAIDGLSFLADVVAKISIVHSGFGGRALEANWFWGVRGAKRTNKECESLV